MPNHCQRVRVARLACVFAAAAAWLAAFQPVPNAKGKYVLMSAAYPTCRPEEEWTAMATPASKARMEEL
jgi:hypothetical protein